MINPMGPIPHPPPIPQYSPPPPPNNNKRTIKMITTSMVRPSFLATSHDEFDSIKDSTRQSKWRTRRTMPCRLSTGSAGTLQILHPTRLCVVAHKGAVISRSQPQSMAAPLISELPAADREAFRPAHARFFRQFTLSSGSHAGTDEAPCSLSYRRQREFQLACHEEYRVRLLAIA